MAAAARASGFDYKTFRTRAQELGLWEPNPARVGVARPPVEYVRKTIPLEEILAGLHPAYGTGHLKRRLLASGLLTAECSICKQGPCWQDAELVLQLDHRNGDSADHRLENLRIVCPNCHSQTDTFAGRVGAEAGLVRNAGVVSFDGPARLVVISALSQGSSIRQALLQAGLRDSKSYYQAVQLLLVDVPELADCPAGKRYRPGRTLARRRSPAEYRGAQHVLWLEAQQEKLGLLLGAEIAVTRHGWATKVARLLDMAPQKVVPWIRKVSPSFLADCKLRGK